jgi:exodeoxyribonuclease-3
MKVLSANLNGIRSADRKEFPAWLNRRKYDVLCFQEIRAKTEQIPASFSLKGYHAFWNPAQKPGYSGVGLLCKTKPDRVVTSMGHDVMDHEGRYIQADFGDLSVVSLYLPSGTSGDARQEIKYDCLDAFEKKLKEFQKSGRKYIVCGDFNIAHTKMDIKNWRGNQKNSGFLPEERAWMDKVTQKMGWVDAFRERFPDKVSYTWWSNRGKARENDVGWRIDYHLLSPNLSGKTKNVVITRDPLFSDHAPFVLDVDL